LVDHGAGRNITAEALAEYDIVITAYPTVASEVPGESKVGAKRVKQSSVLRDIKWARIVLDEGEHS
jgi:SNF2 family DNA or RNA helicase